MIKHIVSSMAALMLVACVSHDEAYYRVHPQELQAVLKQCPTEHPMQVSCQTLHHIAVEVNQLAYELQSNPQGFGSKIITLQTNIFKPQQTSMPSDDNKLKAMQQELAMRLAIVKWLESPG